MDELKSTENKKIR